jgi:hypothetical protein
MTSLRGEKRAKGPRSILLDFDWDLPRIESGIQKDERDRDGSISIIANAAEEAECFLTNVALLKERSALLVEKTMCR